jgi:hypothetical protein
MSHASHAGYWPDGSRPSKDAQDDDFGKRESYEAELAENLKRHKMPKAFLTVTMLNHKKNEKECPALPPEPRPAIREHRKRQSQPNRVRRKL